MTTCLITYFYTDRVYVAKSTEGYNFRLQFTRKNDKYDDDTEHDYYFACKCYDDTFIRYVFYTKNPHELLYKVTSSKNGRTVRNGIGFLETQYEGQKEKTSFNIYSFEEEK